MPSLPKILILIGCVLIVTGGLLLLLGKIPGLGRLPGDIVLKKEGFQFYFPLTTCLLISLLLSLLLRWWNK